MHVLYSSRDSSDGPVQIGLTGFELTLVGLTTALCAIITIIIAHNTVVSLCMVSSKAIKPIRTGPCKEFSMQAGRFYYLSLSITFGLCITKIHRAAQIQDRTP
jgi:hypothetical protein